MRTIIPLKSIDYGGTSGGAAARALVHGSDWTIHDALETPVRVAWEALLAKIGTAPLPSHIDDPRLLKAVAPTAAKDAVLNREQLVTRETLLILCQIPSTLRENVLASNIIPLYHYGFDCTGLLSSSETARNCVIRIRQSDQSILIEATQAMCALLSSRKRLRHERRQTSGPGGSRLEEVTETTPVRTEFGTLELRAVGGDRVAKGEVIQLSSAYRAYSYLLFDGAKRGLFIVGVGLIGVSAALHFGFGVAGSSVGDWVDGIIGRLATAAFGAQLVNSAIDYNELAPKATRRGFRFEAGATIKWTWVDGRTEA